ncbi:LysR family transcriptional regulator [uncultured Sphingomonas sp.]|uniref:LysR family transcriptional regulator n=1 Tax=uncultured Sphingomonas sp. TaxID=158754 RepID=UPI0035CA1AEC
MFDWNDLRPFLAVGRTGTTAAAARHLRVSQPTIVRRIEALETALSARLFDHRHNGYELTALGRSLFERAEIVETAAIDFGGCCEAGLRSALGTLRVTVPENLVELLLMPAIKHFGRLHPNVQVQLLGTDRPVDVARGEADIAVRAGIRPCDETLVAKRVAQSAWAVYCSQDYAATHGFPSDASGLIDHALLFAEPPLSTIPTFAWLDAVAGGARIVSRASSLSHLQAAIAVGLGISVLPCIVADTDPRLVRCFGPIDGLDAEIWLISRAELRDNAVARAMLDCIGEIVTELIPLFVGRLARDHGQVVVATEHPRHRVRDRVEADSLVGDRNRCPTIPGPCQGDRDSGSSRPTLFDIRP